MDVLNDAEDGSDHDEDAGGEQDPHVQTPRDRRRRLRPLGGFSCQADVEFGGDDYEEAEEEQLDSKTADDDPFARGAGSSVIFSDETSTLKVLALHSAVNV